MGFLGFVNKKKGSSILGMPSSSEPMEIPLPPPAMNTEDNELPKFPDETSAEELTLPDIPDFDTPPAGESPAPAIPDFDMPKMDEAPETEPEPFNLKIPEPAPETEMPQIEDEAPAPWDTQNEEPQPYSYTPARPEGRLFPAHENRREMFIKGDDYRELLEGIEEILSLQREKAQNPERNAFKADEKQLEKLETAIEDMQRSLVIAEKTLFG